MRKNLWLVVLGCCLVHLPRLAATGDSTSYLTPKDTIFLTVELDNQKIFEHQIAPQQTLYSLARFYGLSVEELYLFNPGLKDQNIRIGQKVRIPIPNRAIVRYWDTALDPMQYVPVFYVVRKGDTMFRICNQYFRMPMETVMQRSRLVNSELREGQYLLVGWMHIGGIPESYHQFLLSPIERRNLAMRKIFDRTTDGQLLLEHRGVAFWQKESREDSDFYALHRFAPKNSLIEVTNPMNQRVVFVKVIGTIPDRSYKDEVVVVLSPLAAKALYAKDQRFFVQVRYPK